MSNYATSAADTAVEEAASFPIEGWIWANVVGLGVAYGLFAVLGSIAEYGLAVEHESAVRDIALLVALAAGATLFIRLRRRVLDLYVSSSAWVAGAAGIGLSVGLVTGFAVGGPPFDFILGVIALGTIGGALQWRVLRHQVEHPGRLLLLTVVAWLVAGIAIGAVAFLGDPLHQLFGAPEDDTIRGIAFFIFMLTLLGVVGGAVGGTIEGAALRRALSAQRSDLNRDVV